MKKFNSLHPYLVFWPWRAFLTLKWLAYYLSCPTHKHENWNYKTCGRPLMTDHPDQLFYFAHQEPSIKKCNAFCYSQYHVHKCFKSVELWAGRMAKDITQKLWWYHLRFEDDSGCLWCFF
jgi:hypothetical protein